MKTLYWILGIFAVCVVLLFALSGKGATLTPPLEVDKINPHDHVEGSDSSTVVLFEYADFQCPSCKAYYPLVRQLSQQYGNKIAIVYRYFPLTSIHMNAEFAARAAQAASLQGEDKFWAMHDLLFEKQDEWAQVADFMPLFQSYAQLAGLDVNKFNTDFNSPDVKNTIKAYENYALKLGLQGTPTFFLDGKQIENPTSLEAFKNIIDQALAQK